MINIENNKLILSGEKGDIALNVDDQVIRKFAMLYEGQCEGMGATKAAKKFGYTRQRYYQLLNILINKGVCALKNEKSGPQKNYRRSDEVIRQIIRHRFLDPNASAEIIAQKMNQCGFSISRRSVERVISQFGLQKKNYILATPKKTSSPSTP
jgi:transposase